MEPLPDQDPPRLAPATLARLRAALATQRATQARLRVLGDAPSCELARLVAYRRSDAEPDVADLWYLGSQLWADATLLRPLRARDPAQAGNSAHTAQEAGPEPGGGQEQSGPGTGGAGIALLDPAQATETRCHVEKSVAFLDRFWDAEQGGYFARAHLTGAGVEHAMVEHGPRYADDNALVGLALLAAAESLAMTADRRAAAQRARLGAQRVADFLIAGGLWDATFGGGFWWNTDRGTSPEGKPAQANALSALLFGRLALATGEERYRAWMRRTLDWLDALLYDSAEQLYRWSIAYAQPARRQGALRSDRYFNYDQAIAIEAQLLAAQLDGDAGRRPRALAIGQAVHGKFWGQTRGGYNLEAGVEQVFTAYAAWTSLGHLALFDAEGDPRWFAMALENADALVASLGEPDGGYAYRHTLAGTHATRGLRRGAGRWGVDRTRDTSAHAWMQHLHTALAHCLERRATEGNAPSG